MGNKHKALPGQITIEEIASGEESAPAEVKAPTKAIVKKALPPVKGSSEEKPFEKKDKQKKLTQEEIEQKKAEWWARRRKAMKEEKARREEILAGGDEGLEEKGTPEEKELGADAVLSAEDEDFILTSKKVKQTNICKKYGLKQKKLRAAADLAKKMIASKLAAQMDSDYLFALIELMTRGDI